MSFTTLVVAFLTANLIGFIVTQIYFFAKRKYDNHNMSVFWESLEDETDAWD